MSTENAATYDNDFDLTEYWNSMTVENASTSPESVPSAHDTSTVHQAPAFCYTPAQAASPFSDEPPFREVQEKRREMAYAFISEDSQGFLWLNLAYPGDNTAVSTKASDVKKLRSFKYICGSKKFVVWELTWEDEYHDKKNAFIADETINAKALFKLLQKNGVTFTISRRKKSELVDALFSWVTKRADEIEVPLKPGIVKKLDGNFHYIAKEQLTMKELRKRCIK